VVNVFLPLTLGELIHTFETKDGKSFWPYLTWYIVLRFLQSSGGIEALRDVSRTISSCSVCLCPNSKFRPFGHPLCNILIAVGPLRYEF
jgi:hypothetical protein